MSDRPSEIIQALIDKVEGESGQMGFQAVYYGDQAVIPATPVLCIGASVVDTELQPSRLNHDVHAYLLIYHGKIQDVQKNQKEADELAEDLRDFLHLDPQLGGLIIQGYIQRMESGYARRENSLMSTHRMTWHAMTRTVNPFGA